MTRQIKFRAWAKMDEKNVMYEWTPYRNLIAEWIGNEESGVALMLFTGLKDKNGVEIYEGDICVLHKDVLFVVEYHAPGFRMKFGDTVGGAEAVKLPIISNTEVIGNIYENPELLEVQP